MTPDYSADERPPREIAERVTLPGVFLLIVGVINLVVALYMLVGSISNLRMGDLERKAQIDQAWAQLAPEQRKQLADQGFTKEWLEKMSRDIAPFTLGYAIVTLLLASLTTLGGWRMLKLRSHGLAVTGAILASLPVISPLGCCLVGEVVGIWSLVVLFNSDVRASFDRSPEAPPD